MTTLLISIYENVITLSIQITSSPALKGGALRGQRPGCSVRKDGLPGHFRPSVSQPRRAMFTAALPSRSWTAPRSPQTHCLTPKTLSTFWAAERTAPLVSVGPIVRCEIIKTNPIHGLVKAPAG
jgi:hypothetical protein